MSTEEKKNSDPKGSQHTLAIVFVDIVGSASLIQAMGDLVFLNVLQEFHRTVERLVTAYHGRNIKSLGDSCLVVFEEVANVLPFAAALNRSFSLAPQPTPAGRLLRLRFSLHLATVISQQTSYGEELFGVGVNIGARLMSVAQPGQIVISQTARQELPKEQAAVLGPSEYVRLKGIAGEMEFSRVDLAEV